MSSWWSISGANRSLAWSAGTAGGKGRFPLKFPLDLGWYHEQRCTRFRSLQHRKERAGHFRHEFIVLKLLDGTICRFERMGDPDARFAALSAQGSVAHDFAQSFPPDQLSEAGLDTSDVVAEITFSRELDIRDVLKVCRAIHEGDKTGNYTLRSFNCYFFTLAIQSVLTRLEADWKGSSATAWELALDDALNTLSDVYKSPLPARDRQPFLLRIYRLLRPGSRWPVDLPDELARRLYDDELSLQINKACRTVLWYPNLRFVIDHALESVVKDVLVQVLHDNTPNPSDQDPRLLNTDDLRLVPTRHQCGTLVGMLVLQAVARHEQESQTPKLYRLQHHAKLFHSSKLISPKSSQKGSKFRGFNFRVSESPPLSLQIPQSTACSSTSPQHGWIWLAYAGTLVLAVVYYVLSFLRIPSFSGTQPARRIYVEDEIAPTLDRLEALGYENPIDVVPLAQRLQRLCAVQGQVLWRQWPWAHVHEPVKQHILDMIFGKEHALLKVHLQGCATPKAMSVSSFQRHLLERISLHAKRVESFKLGSAAQIRDELEDKLSQVWALTRGEEIEADTDSSYPPSEFSPISPELDAHEVPVEGEGWHFPGPPRSAALRGRTAARGALSGVVQLGIPIPPARSPLVSSGSSHIPHSSSRALHSQVHSASIPMRYDEPYSPLGLETLPDTVAPCTEASVRSSEEDSSHNAQTANDVLWLPFNDWIDSTMNSMATAGTSPTHSTFGDLDGSGGGCVAAITDALNSSSTREPQVNEDGADMLDGVSHTDEDGGGDRLNVSSSSASAPPSPSRIASVSFSSPRYADIMTIFSTAPAATGMRTTIQTTGLGFPTYNSPSSLSGVSGISAGRTMGSSRGTAVMVRGLNLGEPITSASSTSSWPAYSNLVPHPRSVKPHWSNILSADRFWSPVNLPPPAPTPTLSVIYSASPTIEHTRLLLTTPATAYGPAMPHSARAGPAPDLELVEGLPAPMVLGKSIGKQGPRVRSLSRTHSPPPLLGKSLFGFAGRVVGAAQRALRDPRRRARASSVISKRA